ncbi:MAG: DUF3696 domain-containing protein [Bacteroidales bacterium]|nr:DUF3696 domain-containing protein [Bacteroidales bacterium]
MINKLVLKDFKIHSNLELPLGGITILTGQNGMGKSSVMQSLLLLRQSYNSSGMIKGINLKGDMVDLGSANDVECKTISNVELNIMLTADESFADLRFSYDVAPEDTFLPAIDDMEWDTLKNISLFNENFQYISAFRLGPQKGYERDTNIVQYQRQISKINGQCEYAVHFLSYFGKRIHCLPALVLDDKTDDSLESQVQAWMQFVSPRVNIKIEPAGADFKLNYKFSRDGQPMTDEMAAVNVGYGVTYVLPILVAILSAKPGSLILIENPEAHIHPKAQAELMKLIMRAVGAGIQIIMETHSDHIMNGALVAIAQNEAYLELVKAYYFERDDASHTSIARMLNIMKDGRIVSPPKGFFDQIDIDMRLLMGF